MSMNVYQLVTDRIIKQLENGVVPWHKPWGGVNCGAYNVVSNKPYSLLNQMILQHDGAYATFKQWQQLGGRIKRGAKAEIIVFWKIIESTEVNTQGEKITRHIPYLKYYNVFHISSVEGVEINTDDTKHEPIKTISNADSLINEYISREDIKFNEIATDKAFYSPSADMVQVPCKEQYTNINEYYSTVFHELAHSTGHKTRLNRLTSGINSMFGSEEYSKEELVAEISSASIMSMLNIETNKTFTNSTSYIQSWLKVLKNDNRFIVSASSKAEKAVNYILGVA